MSLIIRETGRKSRSLGSSASDERQYTIWGSSDLDVIEQGLYDGTDTFTNAALSVPYGGLPNTINGRSRKEVDITGRDKRNDVWDVVATWGNSSRKAPPEVGQLEVSFDISPQTVKITQSKETLQRYAKAGETAPDFKGGIGFNGKGFDGTDVMVEAFAFSIRNHFAIADITHAFIQDLRDAAFHTNREWFWGQDPGECLFAGCAGSPTANLYALDSKFLSIPNAQNLEIGEITGIVKGAWDNLWVLYQEEEDATAKFVPRRPSAAYVERVYDPISFVQKLQIPPQV